MSGVFAAAGAAFVGVLGCYFVHRPSQVGRTEAQQPEDSFPAGLAIGVRVEVAVF